MTRNAPDEASAPTAPPMVRYLRSSALPAIMIVDVEFRGAPPPATIDQRWRFARCLEGDGDVVVAGHEVRLAAGVLLAIEPGDCIAAVRRRSSTTAFHTMLVDADFIAKFVESAFPGGHARLTRGMLGAAAVGAFDALYQAVHDDADALEQEDALGAFLEAATDDSSAPLAGNVVTPPVARAKRYIDEHFAEDVRLTALEAEVGLSRFYLVRRFRAEVGMPPHAYQLAVRLDRARVLVASGMALADVAARCGFTDQSHLTRHFRRAVGVAPGAYARSARRRR